jgi:hypothetical protein
MQFKTGAKWLYVAIFDLWSAAGRRILSQLKISRGAFSFPGTFNGPHGIRFYGLFGMLPARSVRRI